MSWPHPMRWRAVIGAAGRRAAPPTDPPGGQRRPGTDADAINASQSALSLFLGLADAQALAMACTAQTHRHAALAPDCTAAAPWHCCADAAGQVLAAALAHGPCLLALPFNRPALQLLRQLPGRVRAPIVIIDSPALGDSLARWPLPGALARCGLTEAIQRVKAGAAGGAAGATAACTVEGAADGAAPVLYISFPELHRPSAGTTAQVVFLGQPTLFSLFEPLLCQHGLKTLVTVALAAPGADPALLLSPLTISTAAQASAGAAPAALLRWWVGHLQSMARALPEQTLSWPQLYRNSLHFQAITRSNRLKQLAAFFDAWQGSGSGLQGPTHAFVTAQLAALRRSV